MDAVKQGEACGRPLLWNHWLTGPLRRSLLGMCLRRNTRQRYVLTSRVPNWRPGGYLRDNSFVSAYLL